VTACAIACILALAGPVATVVEGIPYVEMTAAPEGYAVTFHNARVATSSPDQFVVALDGVEVSVYVASLIGDDPDTMTVTPPPGWMCSPCAVTVGENQSATVWLFPVAMG
jgi:hypothetical protein